jgi:glycine/D-amino acid oxidase-like deaminating enzyme
MGRHPEFPSLVVFNGLGTKGVLQSPYHARLLRNWLDGQLDELPLELSSNRFLEKNP